MSGRACVFCGSTTTLTAEHVFASWIGGLGLIEGNASTVSGFLNEMPRVLPPTPAFSQRVKMVCASCNNGWMSELENNARRILQPLILGTSTSIAPADRALAALWAFKTALVSLLMSTAPDREAGYGVPPEEYELLYESRATQEPLTDTQVWISRYEGEREGAADVTPVVVTVAGLVEPDYPQGYLFTIVIGQLLVQGIRFTSPAFAIPVLPGLVSTALWPERGESEVLGPHVTDENYLLFARGRKLTTTEPQIQVGPWKPAADNAPSEFDGISATMDALCHKHFLRYPMQLVTEAAHQRYYAFVAECACQTYLLHSTPWSVSIKGAGDEAWVRERFDTLAGPIVTIGSTLFSIQAKQLPTGTE